MNIRMKYLEELVIEIYGVKLINYHETTDPHSDKPCFELVTGTAAKGLIDELKFTPNYRKRIEDLFTLTFNPDKRIVLKYNDIKYSEIKSKTAKSKTKSDFDQLHMIANFCKFVGIDEFKILDKEYDYAYWYTEESPFEAMEHIDEYAPYVAHVVCCKKSNWPEKAEQLQQSRTVAFPVLEFLKHSKHYQKEFGSIIACILKTKYVPLLFDSIPGVGFDDSKLKDQFETICKQTKYKLLDCLYSKPGRSHNTDIIIVDSTCDKRFDKETKLNPKDPSSGLYDIKREVLPRFYFCIPDLSYRTKRLSPDIDMTGMIQSRYREIKVYLKSGSNLEDNDVVAKDLTNQDSTQMKQRSLLSPELFKQYKAVHYRH